jgi:hypothetical protein
MRAAVFKAVRAQLGLGLGLGPLQHSNAQTCFRVVCFGNAVTRQSAYIELNNR